VSKNVLVISASFRDVSNSDTLAKAFMKGAVAAGHKAEKIILSEHEIHFCMGCGYCTNTGMCVQNDDVAEILEKMLAADVIVFALPVYFYSMPGQLKTLIDITVPVYTKLKNKDFYYILTAADTEKEHLAPVVTALRGFSEMCLEKCNERGILYATGLWKAGEAENSQYMQDAYDMGNKI